MQQESLVDAHPLSVAHTEPTCGNRESESPRTGRCTQGSALATTASLSDQVTTRFHIDKKRTVGHVGLP